MKTFEFCRFQLESIKTIEQGRDLVRFWCGRKQRKAWEREFIWCKMTESSPVVRALGICIISFSLITSTWSREDLFIPALQWTVKETGLKMCNDLAKLPLVAHGRTWLWPSFLVSVLGFCPDLLLPQWSNWISWIFSSWDSDCFL